MNAAILGHSFSHLGGIVRVQVVRSFVGELPAERVVGDLRGALDGHLYVLHSIGRQELGWKGRENLVENGDGVSYLVLDVRGERLVAPVSPLKIFSSGV